jgi:RimJ/RimL family protein N-acetyltransferase
MNLLPSSELSSDRLTFHLIDESIHQEWLPFFKDEGSTRYLSLDSGTPEEQCQRWIKKQLGRYENGNGLLALRDKDSGALIGMCGAITQLVDGKEEVEIAYHILPEKRNLGYASEAARAIKKYVFDVEFVTELVSLVHKDNEYSKGVAHRNGMLPDGETKFNGDPVVVYRAKKYLEEVSFGEYLGAGFVLFLLIIIVVYLIQVSMDYFG